MKLLSRITKSKTYWIPLSIGICIFLPSTNHAEVTDTNAPPVIDIPPVPPVTDTNAPPVIDIPPVPPVTNIPPPPPPPIFKWQLKLPRTPFNGSPEQASQLDRAIRRISYVKDLAVVKLGLEQIKKMPPELNLSGSPELVSAIVQFLQLEVTPGSLIEGSTKKMAAEILGNIGAVNFVSSEIVDILKGRSPSLADTAIERFVSQHTIVPNPEIMDYLVSNDRVDTIAEIARKTADKESIRYLIWYAQKNDRIDLVFGLDSLEASRLAADHLRKRLQHFSSQDAVDPLKPFLDVISRVKIYVEGEPQLSMVETLVDIVRDSFPPAASVEAARILNAQFTRELFDDEADFTSAGLKAIDAMQRKEPQIKLNFSVGESERNRLSDLMKGYWKGLEKAFLDPPKSTAIK